MHKTRKANRIYEEFKENFKFIHGICNGSDLYWRNA